VRLEAFKKPDRGSSPHAFCRTRARPQFYASTAFIPAEIAPNAPPHDEWQRSGAIEVKGFDDSPDLGQTLN
jgi:hypothetical protein